MNRTQFMLELAALLQDISAEERTEAMKYYNDYFDEAGKENEEQILRELGSPEKVAAEIKAGLDGKSAFQGEFNENGYTDPRFDKKDTPVWQNGSDSGNGYGEKGGQTDRPSFRTSRTVKILLILLILVAAAPVIFPVVIALFCITAGVVCAIFAIFFAFVVAAAAIAIVGAALFIAGVAALVPDLPVGLALVGSGMITAVIGVILTVAAVRLCMIVLPGMCRFIVDLLRRPFHRRKAVAR